MSINIDTASGREDWIWLFATKTSLDSRDKTVDEKKVIFTRFLTWWEAIVGCLVPSYASRISTERFKVLLNRVCTDRDINTSVIGNVGQAKQVVNGVSDLFINAMSELIASYCLKKEVIVNTQQSMNALIEVDKQWKDLKEQADELAQRCLGDSEPASKEITALITNINSQCLKESKALINLPSDYFDVRGEIVDCKGANTFFKQVSKALQQYRFDNFLALATGNQDEEDLDNEVRKIRQMLIKMDALMSTEQYSPFIEKLRNQSA